MPDGVPSPLGRLPDAAFVTDDHDVVTEWNDLAEQLLGVPRAQAIGCAVADLPVSMSGPAWRAAAVAAAAEAGRWRGEVGLRRADGSKVSVDWVIGPAAGGGTIEVLREVPSRPPEPDNGTVGIESDAFRVLFDESPIMLGLVDSTTGKYVRANRAFCEMRGLALEDVVGKTEDEISPAPSAHLENLRDELRANGKIEGEMQLGDDSERRYGWFSAKSLRIGSKDYILSTVKDITVQKRAEAALREQNERYLEAVSSISAVIWSANVNDDLHIKDLMLTVVADRILGVPDGTLSGNWEKFLSYVHPDDVEHLLRSQRHSIRHPGEMTSFEYRVVRADGTLRWIRSTGQTRVMPDGGKRIFGVAEDVTEQKEALQEREKLEDQLRQAQKMEAVGSLAGGVAHDFNNILTVISGNVSLALMTLKADEPVRAFLKDVAEASTRAASVTRQLLAFSRRQLIEPKVLPISDLVADMRRMLERLIGEDVKLHTYLSQDIGLVRVDPGQVEQILVNLAVNARHAMPDGGELTIETSQVVLDEAYCEIHADCQPGDYVLLAVSDTGCGMTPEIRSRVFEPFFTTKPKGQGTGMGLAMVYGAVKQLKGTIGVYSEPGRGSVFKIYFPCVAGVPESFHRVEHPTDFPVGGTETILVVEDDSAVRTFAERVLTKLGYKVLSEACGADAVRAVLERRGRIDLLMTDVVLPDMNGRMLADRIHELSPSAGILFTSGYTQNVIVHHGVLDEGIQFLGKPYTARSLAQRIREMLDQR